jgi:signal transduction histidine kinase
MSFESMWKMLLLVLLIFLSAAPAIAVDKLDVQDDRDPRFLPYSIDIISYGTNTECRKRVSSPVHVFYLEDNGRKTTCLVRAHNPPMNEDVTGSIAIRRYGGKTVVENPTYMSIEDVAVYYDTDLKRDAIISACYQNDSAFLEKIYFPPRQRDTLFLATGTDRTGNDQWEPEIRFIESVDYDYDSITELFFHVNPVRDEKPRILFCIDPVNFRVEWSIPVASSMRRGNLVSSNDSINPAVIFGTYSPSQGVTDENFSDSYGYLTMIDSNGKIVYHKLTSTTFNPTQIISSDNDSLFYVSHCLDFLDPALADTSLTANYTISVIDRNFNPVESTSIDYPISSIWLFDYNNDGRRDLYVRLHDGRILIFDSNLELLARSGKTSLGNFLGEIKIAGQKHPVMIFSESGIALYTGHFKKLAQSGIKSGFGYFEPSIVRPENTVDEFIAGGNNSFLVAAIEHRGMADLINIYVAEFRYYLLAAAFGLFCLLIAMLIYRSHMKRSLVLITKQRDEIEQTHRQLQKAFDELESATETIARQREREAGLAQYRIASAQFRHEINNALGAVKLFVSNALRKASAYRNGNRIDDKYQKLYQDLSQLVEKLPEADPQSRSELMTALEDIRKFDKKLLDGLQDIVLKGVDRGLKLSEKLRRYERIDYDDTADRVDLETVIEDVLKEYSEKIKKFEVEVKTELESGTTIIGSKDLIAILVANLLENSIDAILEKGEQGKVIIKTWQDGSDYVNLEWYDTGIGISKESYPRIFQPFYTEKPSKGSGLGLSMVKNIVDKYEGQITFESERGEYTKFILVFPAS